MSDKFKPNRTDPESDRYVPPDGEWVGKLDPNYYCRGWNAGRSKYCSARAGQGTDHMGEGRCKNHGGSTPVMHRRYSMLASTRFGSILEHFDGDPDPLDLLPELALLRATVVDFIMRYDEITDALLAWHHSFSEEYQKEYAEEYSRWYEGDQSEPFLPPEPMPDKPRKMVDLAWAGTLADKIGAMVKRVEDIANRDAVPRTELIMLAQEMGRVVEKCNTIADPASRLRAIKSGWLSIRLRTSEDQPKAVLTA